MSKRNAYTIRILFCDSTAEFETVDGHMNISTAVDNFRLTASDLTIQYERSSKQTPNQAFNLTRLSRIEEIWLLYYSITGVFPAVEKVAFEHPGGTDNITLSEANLPICPTCSNQAIIDSEIATRLYAFEKRSSLLSCVSYLFASRQTEDAMSRFRYLWSSFNCLYIIHPCESKSEYLHVYTLLEAIPEDNALLNIKRKFQDLVIDIDSPSWRWNDFLRGFSPLKIKHKKNGEISACSTASTVLSDVDEQLLKVLMSRKAYLKWKDLPTNNNPILQRQADLEHGANSDRFLFIFSSYLYWLRCDTMHGNSPYPVFMTKEQQTLLKALCDSLESLIPLCIAFICDR